MEEEEAGSGVRCGDWWKSREGSVPCHLAAEAIPLVPEQPGKWEPTWLEWETASHGQILMG